MRSKNVLPIGLLFLAACPDPPGGGETGSESASEESTEATGEATGETTGDGDGDGDGDLICDPNGDFPPTGPYPSATVEALPGADSDGFLELPDTLCVDLPTLASGAEDVWVQVILPTDVAGEVPAGVRFPAMFFSHGNRQGRLGYQETLERFAREGIVVVNVHAASDLLDTSSEPEVRRDGLVCAARWLATNWEPRSESLSCDAVFSGHSNGGQGAALAANQIQNSTPSQPEAQFLVEGLLTVAPRRLEDPLPSDDAVPSLVLASTTENDVPGQQQVHFSNLWNEEELGGVVNSPLMSLVHAYDVEHDAFGGNGAIQEGIDSPLDAATQREKGEAIFRGYGKAFLRHTLFSPTLSDWAVLTGGAFPSEVEHHPGWWNYLPQNPTGDPQIFADVVFQTRTPLGSRLQIDSFLRAPTFRLSPASGGATVTPAPLAFGDIDQVRIGEPTEMVPPEANLDFTVRGYETTAMRVDWSAAQQGGVLRWDFPAPLNVNPYSALSFRSANVIRDFVGMVNPIVCEGEASDADFTVRLVDAVGESAEVLASELAGLPLPQFGFMQAAQGGAEVCTATTYMTTRVWPLSSICTEIDTRNVVALELDFTTGAASTEGLVMLDSLEFVEAFELGGDSCP